MRPLSDGERSLVGLLTAIAVFSTAGLALALLGRYTHLLVLLLCLPVLAGLGWFRFRMSVHILRRVPLPEILLCAVALVLFSRPGEHILGNWDPGVYLAQGAGLARTGGMVLPDTGSAELLSSEKDALYPERNGRALKYPGFYVGEREPHTLNPQFYPLYPVWLAHFRLLGPRAPLYVSGFFALVSVVLAVAVGRLLGGRVCGFLSGLLLLLNPVQLWFAGFHTAELPMQTFFLGGFWCWLLWRVRGEAWCALLAGVLVGLSLFLSVTAWLLAGLFAVAHAAAYRRGRGFWSFYVPLALMFPVAVWMNRYVTGAYFGDVLRHAPVLRSAVSGMGLFLALAAAGLGAAAVAGRVFLRPGGKAIFGRWPLLVAAVTALIVYGLARHGSDGILPLMVSRSGLALAAAGLVLLVANRPVVGTVLAVVAVGFTATFVIHPMMTGEFPWAFKRHLAVALPACCILAAYTWSSVTTVRPGRITVLVVVLACLLVGLRPLYRGRSFALHRDWNGMLELVEDVAGALPDDAVVLARKWLATPVEMHHAKCLVPFYDDEGTGKRSDMYQATVERLLRGGKKVYWAFQEASIPDFPFRRRPVGRFAVASSVMAQSRMPFLNRSEEKSVTVVVEQLLPDGADDER